MTAFGDPRVVSLRWGEQLSAALKIQGEAVLKVARGLAANEHRESAEAVLRRLLTAGGREAKKPGAVRTETVKLRGRTLYKIAPRGNGMQISFGPKLDPKLAKAAQEEVKEALTRFLDKALKDDQR